MKLKLTIKTLSPLHLGNGKSDVIVDAEVVHDSLGLPYFPAKRLKGLLYESALELAEISNEKWFTIAALKDLFGQSEDGVAKFTLDNLQLENYEEMRQSWHYLNQKYPGIFTQQKVLDTYTELRFSTALDKESGTADEGSLRNMRLVDKNVVFVGAVEVQKAEAKNILELAAKNLRFVGAKRNRGCGRVECSLN